MCSTLDISSPAKAPVQVSLLSTLWCSLRGVRWCRVVNVSSNDLPDLHFMHFRLRNDCICFSFAPRRTDWMTDYSASDTRRGLGELEEGNGSLWTFSDFIFAFSLYTSCGCRQFLLARCTMIEDRALHFPQLKSTIVKSHGKDSNSCPFDVDGWYIFPWSDSWANLP